MIWSFAQALELLPPSARRRYARLTEAVEDGKARAQALTARLGTRDHALMMARNAVAVASDPATRQRAEEEMEFLQGEIERLQAERSKVSGAGRNAEQVQSQLSSWITGFLFADQTRHPGPLRDFGPVPVELLEGESLADAIIRFRSAISRARSELASLAAAPPSRDECVAAVHNFVAQLGVEGQPVFRAEANKITITLPDQQLYAPPNSAFSAPSLGASRLLAAMNPEAFEAWLLASISLPEGGVPAVERARLTTETEAKLLMLERQEECLIEQALEAGVAVDRRYAASGWALLNLTNERVSEELQLEAAE
jgi:hypothetical protein